MPKAPKSTKATNRQKVITIRDDEADRVFDVTIHMLDRPETIMQKIRNETAVWPFYITNHKGGRLQFLYTDLKAGGGLMLHRNTKAPSRESREGQRTRDKLPEILETWKLSSAEDIFGQDFAKIAPKLPKPDGSKATFKDLELFPDDFPIVDPEKWADAFTLELWKLSKICNREYGLVHTLEIFGVRYGEKGDSGNQVVEALTRDVKEAKHLLETLMEDSEERAVEIIRARGVGSGNMAFRARDGEGDGEV